MKGAVWIQKPHKSG